MRHLQRRGSRNSLAPDEPNYDLSRVYRAHVRLAWRVVRGMGVPPAEVPDVVQDVFLVVHRRLPDYDARAPMSAWIAGICRGVARNHQRAAGRYERRLRLVPSSEPEHERDPEERMEMSHALLTALDELDEPQRMAVVQIDIEGLSPADVAEIAGIPRNTVYSRLRLARKKLRARLSALRPQSVHIEEKS